MLDTTTKLTVTFLIEEIQKVLQLRAKQQVGKPANIVTETQNQLVITSFLQVHLQVRSKNWRWQRCEQGFCCSDALCGPQKTSVPHIMSPHWTLVPYLWHGQPQVKKKKKE